MISNLIKFFTRNIRKKSCQRNFLQEMLEKNLAEETFNTFSKHIKKSVLFGPNAIKRESILRSKENSNDVEANYYLEFGVFKGHSTNLLSKYVNKLYAFDSFKGLTEDWPGSKKNVKSYFNLNGIIPKLNSNVEIIVGPVEQTLENFLKLHKPKIQFVHMDLDTYNSTNYVLKYIKPYLSKNSIILFDQLYNHYGWELGEFKALKENFNHNEFEYKFFNINGSQVAIEII